jgi:hypothetical protein
MTRDKGNMRIFRQMKYFSNVLIIWRTGIRVLAICEASYKTCDNLKG